jgi:hypothetical protein
MIIVSKIIKYQKVTDQYTTHTLVEPDYEMESNDRITELCNLGGETYVSVPDGVILPEQPEIIAQSLSEVVVTDDLKQQIKKASVHVQLINRRVRNKIAEKYLIEDEIKFIRLGLIDKTSDYYQYVEGCTGWGKIEKAKLGL